MTWLAIFCIVVVLFAVYCAARGAIAIAILLAVCAALLWFGLPAVHR